MEDVILALVAVLLSILTYRVISVFRRAKYWEERGVAYPKCKHLFFTDLIAIFKQIPFYETFYLNHKMYPKHKFVAMEGNGKLIFMAKDAEFVNKIMTKDFQYFVDHDKSKADEGSLVSLGLFSLTGNDWRAFRAKISPTFTTGKLRSMFNEMESCANVLMKNIEKSYEKPDYDCKDDVMSYTMDVIASVIFGIEFNNEELRMKYKKTANELFTASTLRMLSLVIAEQFPNLAKFLGIKPFDQEKDDFFKGIIKQTFEQRKTNNDSRNDYVQLLLNLKEFGKLEVKVRDDDYLKTEDLHVENVEVTDDILTAQAFQFLTAGFEPISNTMLLFLIEVAQREDIQDKLRKEIQEMKEKNEGYNYKSMREMVYLEQCIHETLRKYPVIPFLMRYCVKDYAVNEEFTINKGTLIFISNLGFHYDPAHFPEPEKFNPDRFHSNEPFKNIAYLPFGAGPRVCIGIRFAMMEMKLGLANIIEKFSIKLGEKAKIPVEFNKTSFLLSPCNGYLKLSKIKNE